MKIAVDARLLHNKKSGMGIYLSEVLNRLKKLSRGNEFFYLDYKLPKRSILEKIFDIIYEQFWTQLVVPHLIKRQKAKVLYSPNPPTPLFISVPVVLTIPDLIFYFDPNLNWFIKGYLYLVYRLSALKAKKITTFSKNSKKDIVNILKVSSNKIEIVSPSVNETFGHKIPEFKVEQIKKKFNLKKRYILSIPGTFIARKNVDDLLVSFNNLPREIKENFSLVFVGNKNHPSFNDFISKVKSFNLEGRVIVTGYIPELELRALYQDAFVLVVTAIYEGFGLPPLEAMSKGVPVISYDNSSLSEVVGEAGIRVKNNFGLKKAITELITKKNLRNELIKKGLERVKKYDWNKSVLRLNQIFMEVLEDYGK